MEDTAALSSLTRPLRIFVVENHPDTLDTLQMYLEMMGHTVLTATTMAEALADLPKAECDVLLSDIGLPDGDGWTLLRQANLSRPIYAVAMSGFGMGSDQLKSREAGFRHHLLKPINPERLEAILADAAKERNTPVVQS